MSHKNTKIDPLIELFDVKQTARIVGLTTDMVNYLCRYKIVIPSGCKKRGRGCARKFLYHDVLLLRVLAKLLSNGISVLRLRTSLTALRKRGKKSQEILSKKYVATDGRKIYFKDNGILEIFDSGQTAFAFVLELETIRNELTEIIVRQRKVS